MRAFVGIRWSKIPMKLNNAADALAKSNYNLYDICVIYNFVPQFLFMPLCKDKLRIKLL